MKSKNILLSTAIIAIAFILGSSFNENDQKKYLMVKSVESVNGIIDSYILTIDEQGKTDKVELEKFRPRNIADNAILLNEVINKIAARGYELQSSTGTADQLYFINNFFFVKK